MRLVSANDAVMALAALLAKPPWQRRRGATLQCFTDGSWGDINAAQEPYLCKPEAQVRQGFTATQLPRSCLTGSVSSYVIPGTCEHPGVRGADD